MVLKILSFGDRIKDGEYKLYSSFGKVLNFLREKKLVSLVLSEIGPGPNNIAVSFLPEIKRLEIKKKLVYFDGFPKKAPDTCIYDSAVRRSKKSFFPGQNLRFCVKELSGISPALSMAFVFCPAREKEFKSGFEKKMLARMKKGVWELERGKYARGAGTLSGLGFGLTPSGDDFLGGFTLALKLSGRGEKKIRLILKKFKSENPVSRSFFGACARGRVDLRTKKFLQSLGSSDRKALKKSLEDLLDRGHTSGADFLSGFLFALSKHL
ncbi:MAG: hypothetical protein COT17_00075 [Elusimicrobia bacterium CG08_land_8_20_14_0_20_51_18]|nr:MAG: hypothetical protein COT17_00075 [Elusimicrobia bacterium CG08_land_8_20_14_0_20_51_18]